MGRPLHPDIATPTRMCTGRADTNVDETGRRHEEFSVTRETEVWRPREAGPLQRRN